MKRRPHKQFGFQMLIQRFDVKVIGAIFTEFHCLMADHYTAHIRQIRRCSLPCCLLLCLSCCQSLSCPDGSANIEFASSFQEEEVISETLAAKNDKPFLLSVLSSVGSFKWCCSHGSLWSAGRPTAGNAQFVMLLLR